MTISSDNIAG